MAKLTPWLIQKFYDTDGVTPLSGGQVFTYEAGTSTPKLTYTTQVGDVAQENPIILNSNGEPDNNIWLDEGEYKVVVAPANDTDPPASPIKTIDKIFGINDDEIGIVNTVAELTALAEEEYTAVSVLGYYAAGDGGGGFFRWSANGDPADANGGTIFVPDVPIGSFGTWNRVYYTRLNLKWFGAKGDGTTDDTSFITNCLTWAQANDGDVYVPEGSYKITSGVTSDSTTKLIMGVDASFTAAFAIVLSIVGAFECGHHQCFAGSLEVQFRSRSVSEYLPDWWGADPTGVADSTTAIQAAVSAALYTKGGLVLLPGGTLMVTSTITCHTDSRPARGLTIMGRGRVGSESSVGGTVISWQGDATSPVFQATGTSIRGLRFEGFSIYDEDPYQDGIWVGPTTGNSAFNVEFKSLWIRGYTQSGLMLGDPDGSTYSGQMAVSAGRDLTLKGKTAAAKGVWAKGATSEDFCFYNIFIGNYTGNVSTNHIVIDTGFKINFYGVLTDNLDDDAAAYAISTQSNIRVFGWITEDRRLLETPSQEFAASIILDGVRQRSAGYALTPTVIYWRGIPDAGAGAGEPAPALVLSGCQFVGDIRIGTNSNVSSIGTSFANSGEFVFDGSNDAIILGQDGSVDMRTDGAQTFGIETSSATYSANPTDTLIPVRSSDNCYSFLSTIQMEATGGGDTAVLTFTNSGSARILAMKGRLVGNLNSSGRGFYKEFTAYLYLSSNTANDATYNLRSDIGDATKSNVTIAAPAAVGADNQWTITITNAYANSYSGKLHLDIISQTADPITSVSIANNL